MILVSSGGVHEATIELVIDRTRNDDGMPGTSDSVDILKIRLFKQLAYFSPKN